MDRTSEQGRKRGQLYTGEGFVPSGNANRGRDYRQQIAAENGENRLRNHQGRNAGASGSADRQPSSWQEKLKKRRQRRRRRIILCLGSILAAIYIGVAVYFVFHFYDGTEVFGIDCSRRTVEQVKVEVTDRLGDYKLEIREREGKTETITADQIGLEFVDDSSIDRMMKGQYAFLWPVMLMMDRAQADSVAFTYDRQMAEACMNALECMDTLQAVAPQDAYIGVTETGFQVVSEVMGTTMDWEKTRETILRALDKGEVTVDLEEEGCYLNPQIYQDNEELVSDAAAMSELACANFVYDFGNQQEVVNAPVIKDWIVELSDGTFVIDDVCVTNYVEALAAKYDTFGLPVDFYTSLGTTVTLSGGDYGWCIDQSATVVQLLNALADGYQGTMEPVYLFTAMSHENQGIGYTYVEICISQQRMWCYENGNVIVDTPVVTGNPNKGNGTPSGGVWAIDAKKRNAILTGEGYTAPVDYWMPFNGDVGIHDMQQRAYFGGTIYLTNGSHGCVNTPYDQVQIIYDAVSIGTPVIVYE